eukprot:g2556.t1
MFSRASSRRRRSFATVGERGFSTKGMPITFEDLSYSVPSNLERGVEVQLLQHISGFFKPAEMAALMGPSGSGKTTLLDVLAGRKTQGTITGKIKFSNHEPTEMFLRRYTGYVEQFDTLLSTLTVKEMMMYTAELKRPEWEPLESKRLEVERLVSKLALEVCQNTQIGDQLSRGISGGQAKRVNIGIALITDPRVLFLDEPTSGLDSYTSNEVMTVVKSLVEDGTTICATIHSPSPLAYELFDRIILLLRGQLVFFGKRTEAVPYFESLAIANASNIANEAEWLTDVIVTADREKRQSEFAEQFSNSHLKQSLVTELDKLTNETVEVSPEILRELKVKRATVTPFWTAIRVFLKYRSRKNFTDPSFLGPRLGDKTIFSFLIATLFWGIGDDFATDNYYNIAALLFMWCILPGFGAAAYVPSIVQERVLFYRERNDGLYRVITYLVAKMLDELIVAFIASLIFGSVVYLCTDLQCNFITFWMVYFGTLSNGIALAYLIGALSPNMDVANAAVPAYVVTLVFFTGLLIRFDDMPDYWFWYSRIDFLRYSWAALMVSQFEANDGSSRTILFLDNATQIGVLEYYDLGEKEEFYLGWIFLFFGALFFCAFLAMSFVKFQRR